MSISVMPVTSYPDRMNRHNERIRRRFYWRVNDMSLFIGWYRSRFDTDIERPVPEHHSPVESVFGSIIGGRRLIGPETGGTVTNITMIKVVGQSETTIPQFPFDIFETRFSFDFDNLARSDFLHPSAITPVLLRGTGRYRVLVECRSRTAQ